MENYTVETLIETYLSLRDQKATLNNQLATAMAPVEAAMSKVSMELGKRLETAGVSSMRSEKGTVFTSVRRFSNCGDWGAFGKWAVENDRTDLYQRRLNNTGILELVESGTIPPGIQIVSSEEVTVRKT